MKGKTIALIMLIGLGFTLSCTHRNKPPAAHSNEKMRSNTPDSSIFKQLAKINTFKKADSLYDADVYDSAIYYYQRTLSYPMLPTNPKYKQEIYNRIGYTHVLLGDYKKARFYLEKALTYRNVCDSTLVDANTFNDIGVVHQYWNEPDSAFYYLHKASQIYVNLLTEKNAQFVRLNTNIGNVYRWGLSDYYHAEIHYHKALQIFEAQNLNKNLEQYFSILYSLASTNRLKRDYNKSLSYGLQTLEMASHVEKHKKYLEITFAMVANIYLALKDYPHASRYYNQALEINTKHKNSSGNRTMYLVNLATISNRLGNYHDAIAYCTQALAFVKSQPDDFISISTFYIQLGLAYEGLNQWSKAYESLKRNLALKQRYLGIKHPLTAEAFSFIGDYYRAIPSLDSALHYYQLAIISGTKDFVSQDIHNNPTFAQCTLNNDLIGYLNFKAFVLKDKYELYQDSSLLRISLGCYDLLDSLVSYSRKSMDTESSKLSFTIKSNELYEDAIECAYQLYQLHKKDHDIRKAFQFFERNKYLLLLEKLKVAEATNKAGIPDSLVEADKKLNADLQSAQDKLNAEQSKDRKNALFIQSMNNKIFGLTRRLEELHGVFEKKYPNYFNIRYQDAAVQMEVLQHYLKTRNSNIIQYFWGKRAIYTIYISGDNLKFIKVSNDVEFNDCLTKTIALMHEVNFSSREKFREYYTNSLKLYELLIKPFLQETKSLERSNLIIVPDGLLSKLSLDALVTSKPKSNRFSYKNLDYLIYHQNITYAYSSSILLNSHQAAAQRTATNFLGFGYSDDKTGKKELVGTAEELNEVSKHFKSRIFLGANASEHNFKQNIAGYDIVHLALHGSADEENENGSRLIFRRDNDKVDDGMLYANEVYNLNLRAKLVVLSACETGIGKNYKGEGVFSISRAFSYAGCPSMVISLWNVNDQSTSKLMGNFYNHLVAGDEIGCALHNAKLDFLQRSDEISYQPVFWASFVAFGDMSPIKTATNYTLWLVIGGVSVVLSLLFYRLFFNRKYPDK